MPYLSSLTDSQWEVMRILFESYGYVDVGRDHPIRLIVSAILYLVNNGTKWRELPRDFPPWQTVYYHFSKWSKCGLWANLAAWMKQWRDNVDSKTETPTGIAGQP